MLNEPSRLAEFATSFEDEAEKTLLLVDDDIVSRTRLARTLENRGFEVHSADSVADGIEIARREKPRYAVIELRLNDGCGLNVVSELHKWRADARIIMLTAYGNIATAVAAIKAGAVDYLPKPADADAVEMSLLAEGQVLPPAPLEPMSADRVRWEHIQRVYEQNGRNVSETARRLRMHRRTLQRILSKHAPRDNLPVMSDVHARVQSAA
jgi:two-component system response regulator RegA